MKLEDRINRDLLNLAAYQPGKPVDELARELGVSNIIKLASNENPRGPGERVRKVIRDALGELSRYPDGNGFRLKSALAEYHGVNIERITLGNGTNDLLNLAARVALEPGSESISSEHAFVIYRLETLVCKAKYVEAPARNYGADLDGILNAVTDRTRIVFLANPNNPTGTWVDQASLTAFLDALPSHIWVLLDEAYAEYVQEADYPDGFALLDRYPNLIVTRTFSKIHALAGLRVGYAVSSAEFADLLNRVRQPFNVNSLGLAAAEVAVQDQEFVATSREMNRAGMQQLLEGLRSLELDSVPSIANFVAADMGQPSRPVYEALLREGVIVRPIAEYGMPNHLRISIGLPEENARCIEALRKVLGR